MKKQRKKNRKFMRRSKPSDGMSFRTISIRATGPDSIDEEKRSVEIALATDARNNQSVDDEEIAKRYLALLRELDTSPTSAEAKLELERFFAEHAERSSRESELDSLREEIDKLRAEVETLREKDK